MENPGSLLLCYFGNSQGHLYYQNVLFGAKTEQGIHRASAPGLKEPSRA
jgi:hypothetical protein